MAKRALPEAGPDIPVGVPMSGPMTVKQREIYINTVIPQWKRIKVDDRFVPPLRWTTVALMCLKLNRNCDECRVIKSSGIKTVVPYNFQGKLEIDQKPCSVPNAVQLLLDNHVELTTTVFGRYIYEEGVADVEQMDG